MTNFTSKILKKEFLTPNILMLQIEKPADFDFVAGQFAQFMVPSGDKELPRSYSIASTPKDENLMFIIKIIDSGLGSTYIKNLNEGDEIKVRGPFGKFSTKESDKSLFFIATGTGLAPTISIIHDELENKQNKNKIHLLFGLRNEQDIFLQKELEDLTQKYSNFTYNLTLSGASEEWNGLRGRVTMYFTDASPAYNYFICGSPAMVADIRKILEGSNIDSSQVHFEMF